VKIITTIFLLVLSGNYALAQNGAKAVAAKALQAEALPCDTDAHDGVGCHSNYPAGCGLPRDPSDKNKFAEPDLSFHPHYDPYLAYFKNQIPKVLPASQGLLTRADFVSKYRSALKTTTKITQFNHADVSDETLALGEGQYYTVIGYLYYSQVSGGGEACNCDVQHDDPSDDYHIGIGFDPKLANIATTATKEQKKQLQKASIVVEMTPHYRAKYHKGTWTNDVLQSILGRQVKVVGQLLLDNDHMGANAVCGAPKASADDKSSCWRLSPWELHPVTEFYVCKTAPCAENTSDWIPLDKGKF
jgi:hypothetical protein